MVRLPAAGRRTAAAAARPPAGTWSRLWADPSGRWGLCLLLGIVLASLLGPYLAPQPYWVQHLAAANRPPSRLHWFGTDSLGRDVFARLWSGGRVSLLVGAAAAAADLAIGSVYGGIAGWCGGWVDEALMRAVDVGYGVPSLLVAMLLLSVLRPGLGAVVACLALTFWLGMARLVRGQALLLREREFVLAARGMGAPPGHILRRHLLPALSGPVLVWLSATVPSAIFFESFLSFLGLGVQPPQTSWGLMISQAYGTFRLQPWQLAFPVAALCLTMLARHLAGDALRRALDPRQP